MIEGTLRNSQWLKPNLEPPFVGMAVLPLAAKSLAAFIE
jgi:hypothetical protein